MVDGAGDGHGRPVLGEHRHVRGAHGVQVRRDVVKLGLVGLVAADQAADVVGEGVLSELLGLQRITHYSLEGKAERKLNNGKQKQKNGV